MSTNRLEDPVTEERVGVGNWAVEHNPAAATQATIAKAAAGENVRNVCRSITATIACGATPQTPIGVVLLDGATEKWSAKLAAPANGVGVIAISGLWIVGSPNTAMTLQFAGAGVAASEQAVSMSGIEALQ